MGEIWVGTFCRAGWNFWKWIWKWLSCGVGIFSDYLCAVWVIGFRHVQRGTLLKVYLKSDLFRKVDLEVFMGDFSWASLLQVTYICALGLKLMLRLLRNTPVYFSSKRTSEEAYSYQTSLKASFVCWGEKAVRTYKFLIFWCAFHHNDSWINQWKHHLLMCSISSFTTAVKALLATSVRVYRCCWCSLAERCQ